MIEYQRILILIINFTIVCQVQPNLLISLISKDQVVFLLNATLVGLIVRFQLTQKTTIILHFTGVTKFILTLYFHSDYIKPQWLVNEQRMLSHVFTLTNLDICVSTT